MQFEAQIKDLLKSHHKQGMASSRTHKGGLTKRSKELTKQMLGSNMKRASSSKKSGWGSNPTSQKKGKERNGDIEKKNEIIKKLKTLNQEYLRTIEMLQGEIMLMHEENKRLGEMVR